jgi:hypothetical protein
MIIGGKRMEIKIIEISVPADHRVEGKEKEKIDTEISGSQD